MMTLRSLSWRVFIASIVFFAATCLSCSTLRPTGTAPAKSNDVQTVRWAPDTTEGAIGRETASRIRADSASTAPSSLAFALDVLEARGGGKLDDAERKGVARALVEAEKRYGISVVVALAMIDLESRFDPEARGPAGSIGLMQLQPATAREVAIRHGREWRNHRSLLDPEENARLGLAYLADMQDRFGSTEYAVAAYNIGPGNLRRLLARRPFSRGPYLTKVYSRVDAFRIEYGQEGLR